MPDPDLIHYLDGEADPIARRRLDAGLRSDPDLRAEALLYLRQCVALARVLPTLMARRRGGWRRWWIIGPALAAAAGLATTLLLERGTAPAPPDRDIQTPSPAILAADGRMLRHDGPGSATRHLSDGSVLTLEAGTVVQAALPGSAWRLEAGSLVCEPAAGSVALADGICTSEALVSCRDGGFALRRDASGTLVTRTHGRVAVQDRSTGSTHLLDTRACWIPADTAAPRPVAGAAGIVVTVDAGHALGLHTRYGVFSFRPEWIKTASGGFLDPSTLRGVQVGAAIEIDWLHREHLRVVAVRKLPAIPPDAVIPTAGAPLRHDF